MTLQAVELNAARVLGYGWNPEFEDQLHTYAPGSCTGTYWGSDILEYLQYGLDEDGYINASNFPAPWKWDDVRLHFTYTHFEEFSRNPSRLGESLLYSNATVHEVLPYKVNADPITIENVEDIAQKIVDMYITPQYCFAGEVRVDPACQTPGRKALHQQYGRPCDTINGKSTWSTTKCLFASCELGYYFNRTLLDFGGDCVPIPGEGSGDGGEGEGEGNGGEGEGEGEGEGQGGGNSEPQTKAQKDKFPGWGVALIIIIVVLALVVVALIAYLVATSVKKGKGTSLSSTVPTATFQETPAQSTKATPSGTFTDKAAEVEEDIEEDA